MGQPLTPEAGHLDRLFPPDRSSIYLSQCLQTSVSDRKTPHANQK